MSKTISPASGRWVALFAVWLVLLSGMLSNFVGSPGILQAVRLKQLLDLKRNQLKLAQADYIKLQADASQLESNSFAQMREIRKVLGYTASDEIIFDFSSPDTMNHQ